MPPTIPPAHIQTMMRGVASVTLRYKGREHLLDNDHFVNLTKILSLTKLYRP